MFSFSKLSKIDKKNKFPSNQKEVFFLVCTKTKKKKTQKKMSSFQSDDSIEEPPAMPLRHSTGGEDDDDEVEFGYNPYQQVKKSPMVQSPNTPGGALMKTTRDDDDERNANNNNNNNNNNNANNVEQTHHSRRRSGTGEKKNNNDADTTDSNNKNPLDDDLSSDDGGGGSTGTMKAARGNVLESAASLKWSTGEILPPATEHAPNTASHMPDLFDGSASYFPTSEPRSSSAGGDLKRAASESGGGPASWIIDANEIQFNKEIGRGSFGAVYTAKLRGSDVAVKKLYSSTSDADILADFSQEVSIMTKLRHPHVLLFLGERFRLSMFACLTD
jgi:hypothetical protein